MSEGIAVETCTSYGVNHTTVAFTSFGKECKHGVNGAKRGPQSSDHCTGTSPAWASASGPYLV